MDNKSDNLKDKLNMDEEAIASKEQLLSERMKRLEAMEQDIKQKEKQMKDKEKAKKQVLLRLAPSLWEELAAWAEDEYRSINSQIEFLLAECVRKRKKL